jgi:hypothetical protein
VFSEQDRTQLHRDRGVTFGQELAEFQAAPGGADVVREGFLAGRSLEPVSQAMMLSHVDGAARAEIVNQLQRTHGNAYVQRLIADIARHQRPGQVIQRQGGGQPAGQTPAQPTGELKETTVPVPEQQRTGVANATQPVVQAAGAAVAQPAAQPAAQTGEPPPVPEQARIRAPVEFNFSALPPELQIRLLDELSFTATVTAARLLWARDRFKLGLSYSYGGALTGSAAYQVGGGTFTGQLGYTPGTGVGSLGLGYQLGQFQAGLSGTTQGAFGATLSYGAALPPMPMELGGPITAGEAAGRNLLRAVPELLSNPLRAPEIISAHSADIDTVGDAARTVGRVVDLSQQDPNRVRWGFYINASRAPGGGLGVTAGAGVVF